MKKLLPNLLLVLATLGITGAIGELVVRIAFKQQTVLFPRYHALLSAFKARTGCPVLVNTSFNVRGEPMVCTPEDAFHCFMGTEMETLVAGNCLLRKERQDPALAKDYKDKFELD